MTPFFDYIMPNLLHNLLPDMPRNMVSQSCQHLCTSGKSSPAFIEVSLLYEYVESGLLTDNFPFSRRSPGRG